MWSITPIDSVTYVNQQVVSVSNLVSMRKNSVQFQNMLAQAAAQQKEMKVSEVQSADAEHIIDNEEEHNKNEADQETNSQERKDKKKESNDKLDKNISNGSILDIKV